MQFEYKEWLSEHKGYQDSTVQAQTHRVGRVEKEYGDLMQHFDNGSFDNVVSDLSYTAQDSRSDKINPSKIEIQGDIRSNLSSYRNAILLYREFLILLKDKTNQGSMMSSLEQQSKIENEDVDSGNVKFALERDMQRSLRDNIFQLSDDLKIIDDGVERYVRSGKIDILCIDKNDNSIVVIELKAGTADAKAVSQLLGYMGDLIEEDEAANVKGILIANEFNTRCRSAARAIPSLRLLKYEISFKFMNEGY